MRLNLLPAAREDLALPSRALESGLTYGFEGDPVGAVAAVTSVLGDMLKDAGAAPWRVYWAVRDRVTVGLCSFKGPPDGGGAVEIAYYVFPDFEGAGVGGAMAGLLIDLARGAGAGEVTAHTLPVEGASPAILRRHGFTFGGDVNHPDNGPVWRWSLPIGG